LKQFSRAWFDKFSTIVAHYGLRRSSSDHSIFVRHSSVGVINFTVYVDDIIVTRDDHQGVIQLKAYLSSYFHMKDIDFLRYFLGIEVVCSPKDLSLSHRKYLADLLEETGTLGSKSIELLWILIFVLIKNLESRLLIPKNTDD